MPVFVQYAVALCYGTLVSPQGNRIWIQGRKILFFLPFSAIFRHFGLPSGFLMGAGLGLTIHS